MEGTTTEVAAPCGAELLAGATRVLAAAGIGSARLDADVLLRAVCRLDRAALYRELRQPVDEDVRARFAALVARRAAREPLQYIVGRQEFWSRDFAVTPAVLVPRPETELLVEAVLADTRARRTELTGTPEPVRLCDVGTGSGCLAVTLACEVADAEVWALDIAAATLAVAASNAERHGVATRVHCRRSDLLEAVADMCFNVIVSNPPYVPSADLAALEPELAWEPRGALDGGADGLDLIRRLLPAAYGCLTRGGVLAMELGTGQAADVVRLTRAAGFAAADVHNDYAGIPRVLVARR